MRDGSVALKDCSQLYTYASSFYTKVIIAAMNFFLQDLWKEEYLLI